MSNAVDKVFGDDGLVQGMFGWVTGGFADEIQDAGSDVMGGEDKSAQRAQIAFNKQLLDLIKQNASQARQDALRLFPEARRTQRLGQQQALDVLGQTIPQQLDVFQGGNVAAQQQLIGGLPQVQAALMGTPINFGGFNPVQLGFDPGFAQQTLPESPLDTTIMTKPATGPGRQTPTIPEEPAIDMIDIANALGGTSGAGLSGLGVAPSTNRFGPNQSQFEVPATRRVRRRK